jgi:hypothetical protein
MFSRGELKYYFREEVPNIWVEIIFRKSEIRILIIHSNSVVCIQRLRWAKEKYKKKEVILIWEAKIHKTVHYCSKLNVSQYLKKVSHLKLIY